MMEHMTMSSVMTNNSPPSEIKDSDAYNCVQLREAILARSRGTGSPPADTDQEALRVLIVDSYRDSTNTMSMLVRYWKHDVRQAYDGTTGLALASAFRPNVLLLDIDLPGISGLELAMQVRRQPRLADCLIVVMTGYSDPKLRMQCDQAGIELFLIKPVDLSHLQILLQVVSERRKLIRQDSAHQPRDLQPCNI
jgi:two-component system OmpR family response regulator